jgi:hypothetical protein
VHASYALLDVYAVDLDSKVLSLQGLEDDSIEYTGDFNQYICNNVDWNLALRAWEHGGGVENWDAFNRTITAGCWSKEPLNWKQRIPERGESLRNAEDKAYVAIVRKVCVNRRFFVTRKKRLGLGPWN